MQRLMTLLLVVVLAAACGSEATVGTDGETTSATEEVGADELRGVDDIRAELATMRSRWSANGPARYILTSHENCPTCDVAPRQTAVIDGVPFPLTRDGGTGNMQIAFDELERTLGHEQYDDHVARFDAETGALQAWTAVFSPVGGSPDITGDSHQLEPLTDEIATADQAGCSYDGWQRIGASGFEIRVPAELEDRAAEGVDSEIGEWVAGRLVVTWDYGWYSEPLFGAADERTFVVHGDRVGLHVDRGQRLAVFVPQVVEEGGEWNALALQIAHSTDDADLARCIAHSIEWT